MVRSLALIDASDRNQLAFAALQQFERVFLPSPKDRMMSVVEALPAHLPRLHQFERALTGSEAIGDNYVLAALEATLSCRAGINKLPASGISPHSLLPDSEGAARAG